MVSQIPPRIPGVQPFDLGFLAGGLLVLLLVLILFAIVVRKFLRRGDASPEGQFTAPVPDPENASAFMAASMQGVIEKLRTQEKELARLHLVAQERAQESERLTEEVTRNMPTGLAPGECDGRDQQHKPGSRGSAGYSHLAIPLVQRNSRRRYGADALADGVFARGANVPSRRSGTRDSGR